MPPISPEESPVAATRTQPARVGPLEPLKIPVFRMLWTTWLIANVCMWMNDVAAAWMMTSLTTSPIWVALVQSASTLPVFLLGLPSGALADILDRRRWLVATQFWLAGAAIVLCASVVLGGWARVFRPEPTRLVRSLDTSPLAPIRQYVRLFRSLVLFAEQEIA